VTLDDTLGPVLDWKKPPAPARVVHAGRKVRLEPLDPARHGAELYRVSHGADVDPKLWLYLTNGPFADETSFRAWLDGAAKSADPLFFTVIDAKSGRAVGMMSYMRITPDHGVIEIGNIWFGPVVQRSPVSTEATYLLARHVFDELGYRRLEWKCNALNMPSRAAALRFGFAYEGLFRRHFVIKNRSRDTTWFAMVDADWPVIRAAFEAWLAPANFDAADKQRRKLADIRGEIQAKEGKP